MAGFPGISNESPSSGGSDSFVKRRARFETPGTFSYALPAEVSIPILGYLVGIAGGGGGATGRWTTSLSPGGQAGSNGEACYFFPVRLTPGISYSVEIGSGGSGAAQTNSGDGVAGSAGGDTAFGFSNGDIIRMQGGLGGQYDNSSNSNVGPSFDSSVLDMPATAKNGADGTFSQPSHFDRVTNGINGHYSAIGLSNSIRMVSAYSFSQCSESGLFYGRASSSAFSGSAGAGSPFEDGYGADGGQSRDTTSPSPNLTGINGADASLFGCGGGGGGGLRMSSSIAVGTRRGGNGKEGFMEIYY